MKGFVPVAVSVLLLAAPLPLLPGVPDGGRAPGDLTITQLDAHRGAARVSKPAGYRKELL